MKTYEQQTLQFGEDGLTCFPEDSPVNRSARQGKEKERRTTATYGRKCFEQFARFPRVGSWAKTFSELLIGTGEWYSSRCALTWRLKGTKFNRMYFQLAASVLPINGIEFGSSHVGLWKTPVAADCADRKFYTNSRGEPQLSAQAKIGYRVNARERTVYVPANYPPPLGRCSQLL